MAMAASYRRSDSAWAARRMVSSWVRVWWVRFVPLGVLMASSLVAGEGVGNRWGGVGGDSSGGCAEFGYLPGCFLAVAERPGAAGAVRGRPAHRQPDAIGPFIRSLADCCDVLPAVHRPGVGMGRGYLGTPCAVGRDVSLFFAVETNHRKILSMRARADVDLFTDL